MGVDGRVTAMWLVRGLFRHQDTKQQLQSPTHRLLKPAHTYLAGRSKEHLLSFAEKYISGDHFSISVGEHTELQAVSVHPPRCLRTVLTSSLFPKADPTYIPSLTLIAHAPAPSAKPNGATKTFTLYLTKASSGHTQTISGGGQFALEDGDRIVIAKEAGAEVQ